MIRTKKILVLLIYILLLSGCKENSYEKEECLVEQSLNESADYEEISKLENLSIIMEKQIPQIKYGEMDKRLLDFYTEPLKEEYEFYGRFSNLGYSYILGICKREHSPLTQLELGPERTEFPTMDINEDYIRLGKWTENRQFEPVYDLPGVATLYMTEKADVIYLGINQPDAADLRIVFNQVMNKGEQEYLERLHRKGAQLLPPVEGAFIQVRSLEMGKYHCVYLSIDQDTFDRMAEDESNIAEYEIEALAIELYTSIDTWYEGERRIDYMNQSMFEAAESHSLIKTQELNKIQDIEKIELFQTGNPDVLRVIEDTNTIKKIEEILRNSHFTELGGCPYTDLMILTKTDGNTVELQLAADSCDGFVSGSYSCFTPGKKQWEELRELLDFPKKIPVGMGQD